MKTEKIEIKFLIGKFPETLRIHIFWSTFLRKVIRALSLFLIKIRFNNESFSAKSYSEPSQTSGMKHLAKVVSLKKRL